jgi:catechol 2,3-dioxygenase-like lactoylglutathione lyase family enzyme
MTFGPLDLLEGATRMDASVVSHIAICTRNMEKSLAFYRDILGMKVLSDGMTDPTEGGRLHNYQQARKSRRRVSLSFGAGKKPTLTITNHAGEDIAGAPLKLDQMGITHFSFSVPDATALMQELQAKGVPLAGPREAFINAQGQVRSFYVHDPDGIMIQFDSGLNEG